MSKFKITNVQVNFLNKGYNMCSLENGTNFITTNTKLIIGTEIDTTKIVNAPNNGVGTLDFDGVQVAANKATAKNNESTSLTNTVKDLALKGQGADALALAQSMAALKEAGLI